MSGAFLETKTFTAQLAARLLQICSFDGLQIKVQLHNMLPFNLTRYMNQVFLWKYCEYACIWLTYDEIRKSRAILCSAFHALLQEKLLALTDA